jgi:hypothetical protein
MILLTLIAALAAQAPPATATPDEDIVVVGERMDRIRVVTYHDRKSGTTGCRVRRSSGDDRLDGAVCAATLASARTETKVEGMVACMNQQMADISRRFAKSGAAER